MSKAIVIPRNFDRTETLTELRRLGHMEIEGTSVTLSPDADEYVEKLLEKMLPADLYLVEAHFAEKWNHGIDYGHLYIDLDDNGEEVVEEE